MPLLQRPKPYLGQLVPVINYINRYRREIAAFFANSTATTEGTLPSASGANKHYLRVANVVNPEVLMPSQTRPQTNRSNPYMAPGGYTRLERGLEPSAATCARAIRWRPHRRRSRPSQLP